MLKRWVGLGLGVWFVVGCGSSDGASSATTPPEECEAFIDDYCDRGAACIIQNNQDPGATEAQEKAACVNSAKSSLPCDKAVAIGATYNSCLADLKALDCSAITAVEQGDSSQLPTDCVGVIKLLE